MLIQKAKLPWMTAHYGNKVIAISKLSCYVIGADNYSQILFHNIGKLDFAVSEIEWCTSGFVCCLTKQVARQLTIGIKICLVLENLCVFCSCGVCATDQFESYHGGIYSEYIAEPGVRMCLVSMQVIGWFSVPCLFRNWQNCAVCWPLYLFDSITNNLVTSLCFCALSLYCPKMFCRPFGYCIVTAQQ